MNFSIARIIRHRWSPQHNVSCSWFVWQKLLRALRARGHSASRESGAFLLGHREDGTARIVDFILYDDVDPHALDSGIVRFDGRYYGDLWEICRQRGLNVVADVHVHPGDSGQSASDRAHPMISRAGHIALIIPDFARGPVRKERIGIYRYLGGKQWHSIPRDQRCGFLHIGV